MRADKKLVELGLVPSRARAAAEIRAGNVMCDRRRIERASEEVPEDAALRLEGAAIPWVSRGGVKLAHALDHFAIGVAAKIALDIGASTGGFTDVLLAHGAARVYAVDVGHDQLHEKLRADPRVILRERVNARELTREVVPEAPDLIVADVSFISLKLVLPPALALAAPRAALIALIKPQFEAGPDAVKKGVVRSAEIHAAVCADISAWVAAQGWQVLGITESPLLGAEGNREFLLAAARSL